VGGNRDVIGYDHAYEWNKTLGWRSLEPPGVGASWASGINDAGVVAANLPDEAALWQTDGQIIRLGDLGGQFSAALAVNSAGDVAGLLALYPVALQTHAFIWHQGAMQDLGITDTISKGWITPSAAISTTGGT
jgi:uncharacterized membrane protein